MLGVDAAMMPAASKSCSSCRSMDSLLMTTWLVEGVSYHRWEMCENRVKQCVGVWVCGGWGGGGVGGGGGGVEKGAAMSLI